MVERSNYFELFMGEASELIAGLNRDAIEYERDPAGGELIDSIFRAVHTLKGMAGIMEYRHLASFLHDFESMLDGLRKKTLEFDGDVASLLFKCIDGVSGSVAAIGRGEKDSPPDPELSSKLAAVVPGGAAAGRGAEGGRGAAADSDADGGTSAPAPSSEGPREHAGHERRTNLRLEDEDRKRIFDAASQGLTTYEVIVRLADDCAMPRARAAVVVGSLRDKGEVVREQQLDRQMTGRSFGLYFGFFFISALTAEEIVSLVEAVVDVQEAIARPTDVDSLPKSSRLPSPADAPSAVRAESPASTRVELARLARLMDVTGELLLARLRIEDAAGGPERRDFDEAMSRLEKLMSELQHEVLKLQLIPIDHLFGAYPRLVRDAAAKQGKKVRLLLKGGEIGLDKRALDALNDPIMHLIRNAVGHGIELPQERLSAGKPGEGTVAIEAKRERDMVTVTLSDDGKGIDFSLAGEGRPPDGSPELFEMLLGVICRAGFSTSSAADAISGRGVGMEVVKSGVEAIGGKLELFSVPGAGTTFKLSVPLTLSITHALLFEIGPVPYAMPLSQISEIVDLGPGEVHRIDRFRVFKHRGRVIPLIDFPFDPKELRSHGSIGSPGEAEGVPEEEPAVALVVEARSRPVGLRIDRVRGRQETIVKPMPQLLRGVAGLSGATILGDGRVAFVLDLSSVV